MDPQTTFVELHGHRIVSRVDPDAWRKEIMANGIRQENAKRLAAGSSDPQLPVPQCDGWIHELYALINPRTVDGHLVSDGVGGLVGEFPTLGLALAEAKRRCPPEPMPVIESVEYLQE